MENKEVKKIGEFELNKIYCMDCLEGLKKIPDNSIDLIVTDPPYGMNFLSNHRKEKYDRIEGDNEFPIWVFNELFRIAKKGIYVFCRWDNLKDIPKPKSFLCWVKNNWSMGDLQHEHGRQWEGIAFYPMKEHKFIKRIPDIIKSKRTGNNLHPTEKPRDLIRQIINANECESILDPFAGSGSFLVAGKECGKNFIGFEISPEYCKIAEKRLAQEVLF